VSATLASGRGEGPPGSRKPTIVVVDDCAIALASTAEALERAGYRVITRERPAGCVAMMLQEKPDLVLLDVCMPTVAGDTLVKLFSKASPNSGTIILLYSALDEPLLRSKAKASGAHGYIAKGNDPTLLVRAVKRWLRSSTIEVRAPSPDAVPPSSSSARFVPMVSSSAEHRRVEVPASVLQDRDLRTTVSGERRRASGAFQLQAPSVLFVDGDMQVLSGYRRQLQGQPFEFDFALSAGQALRLLRSVRPPSVVVCHVGPPELDGNEILRQALDHDSSWNRRFIVVAEKPLDAKKSMDRRFFGALLRKPAPSEELLAAIRASLTNAGIALAPESVR
jgi:two-component system chemotaxis response regulator CheY